MTDAAAFSPWIDPRELYDPLSQNLFRLLGCTREVELDGRKDSFIPEFVDVAGLEPRQFVDDPSALFDLLHQAKEHHQAYYTWFDGRTEADQQALKALMRDEFWKAEQIWKELDEPHSHHNLAILDYLVLLRRPESDPAWKAVLSGWSELATRTNVDTYAHTVDVLCLSLEKAAKAASRLQRPDLIRRCLSLLQEAYSEEQLDALQISLLEADARSLELACAEVRNTLADFSMDILVMETAQNQINARVKPVAEFLLNSALPNSPFGLEVREQVSLVLRATARAWGEMNEVDRQRSCIEAATEFSRPEDVASMKEELRELERVPATILPPAVPDLGSAPKPETNWTALLGLAVVALLALCFVITPSQLQSPSKTALQNRLKIVLRENDSVLNELKTNPSPDRVQQLRQRNEQLRAEMSSLERALKTR